MATRVITFVAPMVKGEANVKMYSVECTCNNVHPLIKTTRDERKAEDFYGMHIEKCTL